MNLFDQLVNSALNHQKDLSSLRPVVEKELLHHDILRILSHSGLLTQLTFIGGTCLRACYGSDRLSEDLDFTGGAAFNRSILSNAAQLLITNLKRKYGLEVTVSEPVRETGNVDTWKLKVQTRPQRKDFPAQRINIDVCSVPSYQVYPMMLRNPYGVDMGTGGLILQVESREEIFCDKLVAFALRPNRIKYRDLWDIAWLHQQGVKPAMELLGSKVKDHRCSREEYLELFLQRVIALTSDSKSSHDFQQEMRRFLPSSLVAQAVNQPQFWDSLTRLMNDFFLQAKLTLTTAAQ